MLSLCLFFAILSAELQLGTAKGVFRKKVGNEDYARQREVLDFVKGSEAWKHSGGRDHVFVLTVGCISMYNASHYKWKCGVSYVIV
ncbi:putative exostosin [Helianthus annuus]|nr:putative exostosin [Helianthus annuus]